MSQIIYDFFGESAGCVDRQVSTGRIVYHAPSICRLIGIRNTSVAMRKIPGEEKILIFEHNRVIQKNAWYLSEQGIYRLLMKSRTSTAERFRTQICCNLLPGISRTLHEERIAEKQRTERGRG